jgi:hypothetical protein
MAAVGLRVDELEWDEANSDHCAEHGLFAEIAEEVRARLPLLSQYWFRQDGDAQDDWSR